MTVDERIEDLGYKLVSHNDITGIFTYENQVNNQRVCLVIKQHGAENSGILYTETISTYNNSTIAIGLTFAECRAFLDKADEIRNNIK